LAASANSYTATVGNLVLYFSDGTASPVFQFNNSDWFFQPNAAILGFGRLVLTSTTAEDDGNSYPELYQTTINLAELGLTNHALVSVEFVDPSTDPRETTGIFAISGLAIRSLPPVVRCKNITVSANASCMADASVDDGSSDPNAGGTITLVQSPPGPYPLGDTSVTMIVTDNLGGSNSCVATVTVVDTTPPVITCPDSITTDATSPAGAMVTFTPIASDNCSLVSVTSSPASGSFFAIGDATVTSTATDAAGNQSPCTFTVHVRGAAEQISNLIGLVQTLDLQPGTANSLSVKLQIAARVLERGNINAACGILGAFLNEVNAQTGKKLTAALADFLITDVARIHSVLGCSETQASKRRLDLENLH
jgi:hypothetical protein